MLHCLAGVLRSHVTRITARLEMPERAQRAEAAGASTLYRLFIYGLLWLWGCILAACVWPTSTAGLRQNLKTKCMTR